MWGEQLQKHKRSGGHWRSQKKQVVNPDKYKKTSGWKGNKHHWYPFRQASQPRCSFIWSCSQQIQILQAISFLQCAEKSSLDFRGDDCCCIISQNRQEGPLWFVPSLASLSTAQIFSSGTYLAYIGKRDHQRWLYLLWGSICINDQPHAASQRLLRKTSRQHRGRTWVASIWEDLSQIMGIDKVFRNKLHNLHPPIFKQIPFPLNLIKLIQIMIIQI